MPKRNKVIGIVGSRRRNTDEDYRICLYAFNNIYIRGDRIVSGGCPQGGDRFAEIIARAFAVPITIYYADWVNVGKRAGFKRNTDIARDCDVLIALAAEDRKGGTEDTVAKVLKLGKEVILA